MGNGQSQYFPKNDERRQGKKSYRAADSDIARGSEEYYNEEVGKEYIDFSDLNFTMAKIDLLKAGVSEDEMDTEAEDIDYTEAQKKTLNKPFRLPSGSKKKFGVYVKNDKGNVVMDLVIQTWR